MTLFSAHSPVNGGPVNGGAVPRRAAAVALGAGALALAAGCSTGSGGSPGATGSPRLTAHQAISLAANDTQRVNSMAGNFTVGVGTAGSTSGTVQLRLKPSLLAHETISANLDGQKLAIEEVLSSTAIYIKEPFGGKPWAEIPFSELKGGLGSSLASLLQSAQAGNPAEQTRLLTGSKNVHVVGTATIDGVQTTHYAGTLTPSEALSALPAATRKGLAPELKLVTGDISFNAWIDGQHVARKVVEVETVSGQTVNLTFNVTAVNQPVQITPPPASQVAVLPTSALGSL